jgi:hypothetical protein
MSVDPRVGSRRYRYLSETAYGRLIAWKRTDLRGAGSSHHVPLLGFARVDAPPPSFPGPG